MKYTLVYSDKTQEQIWADTNRGARESAQEIADKERKTIVAVVRRDGITLREDDGSTFEAHPRKIRYAACEVRTMDGGAAALYERSQLARQA